MGKKPNESQLIKRLLSDLVKMNKRGSLENLRHISENGSFSSEEMSIVDVLVARAHMCSFDIDPSSDSYAAWIFDRQKEYDEIENILSIIMTRGQVNPDKSTTVHLPGRDTDRVFFDYCSRKDIEIIKNIQVGIDDIRRCSWVYLVRDSDGIVKIFKELIKHECHWLPASTPNESDIYQSLPGSEYRLKFYGEVEVGEGISFVKLPYNYQWLLSRFVDPRDLLSLDEAIYVINGASRALTWLHENKVLHLDIKPSNITLDLEGVKFFDFGVSKIIQGEEEVDIWLADPRYGTPECGQRLKASKASDVFQLGIVFHEILTGRHPFMVEEGLSEGDSERESTILKYFWPNTVLPYEHDLVGDLGDKRLGIVSEMLQGDPVKRPSADDVTKALSDTKGVSIIRPRIKNGPAKKEGNTVIFPARMGIPHKGHIEYISRILELGFYVKISIQRSYTITDRDPIPKWLVMKMVANSLINKGHSRESFEFMLTPYYGTEQEMKLHFLMMPSPGDLVAVASSNPDVLRMFGHLPALDQKTVFGVEGEKYDDKSWGEILRRAVREGDYDTFLEYVASGVEMILSFNELQEIYGKPEIEFVSGRIKICLADGGEVVAIGRVFKYITPEESLVRHLVKSGHECEIEDPYSRYLVLMINGKETSIEYYKTVFDGENLTIFYKYK